jgi:hypothetical protein|tara:strand:- start:1236 stop:1412 length:177 start_codon:yes stop_codon:yes gene_type:complete
MIKIFTTNNDAYSAGTALEEQFKKWKISMEPNGVEILDVNSNSNQYGWMMIITYKIIR